MNHVKGSLLGAQLEKCHDYVEASPKAGTFVMLLFSISACGPTELLLGLLAT